MMKSSQLLFFTLICLCWAVFGFDTAQAQDPTDVDVRFGNFTFSGCPGGPTGICVDVQVKSSDVNPGPFGVGSAGFVVQYDDAVIANPVYTANPVFDDGANYETSTTIVADVVSIQTDYVSSTSQTLAQGSTDADWTSIGTICWDILDANGNPDINYITIANGDPAETVVINPDFEDELLNNNYPDGTNFTGPLECIDCPTFTSAQANVSAACDGDQATLSVTTSDNSGVTVNWTLPGGGGESGTSITPTLSPIGFTGCQETQTFSYEVLCIADGTSIATGSVEIELYQAITSSPTPGGCIAAVTANCPEFTATWDDGNGGTGTGFVYNASGNTSGTVTFTISNGAGAPAACASETFPVAYECIVTCPSTDDAPTNENICSGGSAAVPSLTINDGNGNNVEWFDGTPAAGTPLAEVDFTNNTCDPSTILLNAYILCDEDGDAGTADTYQSLGFTHTVNLYPAPFSFNGTAGACGVAASYEVTAVNGAVCASDTGTAPTNPACDSGQTNDESLTYTNTFFGGSGCAQNFNETVSATCAALPCTDCPSTAAAPTTEDVCSGIAASPIAPALIDDNGNAVEWFQGNSDTGTPLVSIDWTNNGCTETTVVLNAYILCDDDENAATPDVYQNLSYTHTVTVYPAAFSAIETVGGCNLAASVVINAANGNECDTDTGTAPTVPACGTTDNNSPLEYSFTYFAGTDCAQTLSGSVAATCATSPCGDCPSKVTDDVSSSESICSGIGGPSVPTLDLNDPNGNDVEWFNGNPDTGGIPLNSVEFNNGGCDPLTIELSAYILCDDDENPATPDIYHNLDHIHFVTVYPAITASSTDGGCAASVSQDCPQFTATWTDGTNNGSGFSYSASTGANGDVVFTVSNPDAPSACASQEFVASYNCAFDCPEVIDVTVDNNNVCSGSAITLTANISDTSGATILWSLADGTSANTFTVNTTATTTGCSTTNSYAYEITCIDSGELLSGGSIDVFVYPSITSSVTNGGCAASISQDCPEFTASWDDGTNTGTGFNYNAASNTTGSVTFTVTNSDAPAGCSSGTFEATYDCSADCPGFNGATASASTACNGDMITLSADITNIGAGTLTWFLPGGLTSSEPTLEVMANTEACSEILTYAYELYCTENGTLILGGSLDVNVFGDVSATPVDGACSVSINTACPEYTVSWENTQSGETGTGTNVSISNAGTSGTVAFTVTNPDAPEACQSASYSANFNCSADCPSVNDVAASSVNVCDGGSVTITADVSDESLASIVWTLPDGNTSNQFSLSPTVNIEGCTQTVTYSYVITCIGNSQELASGDVTITAYPDITATVNNGGCAASLSQDCAEFTATWSNGTETGTGFSYNAGTNASGTVNFTVSNPNAPVDCASATFSATYACDADCPSFNGVDASSTAVCDGGALTLTANISDITKASITWTRPDGSTSNSAILEETLSSESGCQEVVTFSYVVSCIDDGSILGNGNINVNIYPEITATVSNGGCAASVTQDCPEFEISWNDGSTSGTGNTYAAAINTTGTVNFTILNPSAPDECASATFSANYACNALCPTVDGVTSTSTAVCSGNQVSLNANLVGEGNATVTWTLPNGTSQIGNNLTVNPSITACTEVVEYTYTITCDEDGSLLDSGNISLTVYPNITATVSNGGCLASISQDCPEFSATWSDGTNTGEGFTYNATLGNTGSVTFNVSSPGAPAACATASFSANYDCPFGCPEFISASTSSDAVCNGGSINLTAELTDASLATVTWTLPSGLTQTGPSITATANSVGACTESVSFDYLVSCNVNGSTIASGSVSTTVYPSISADVTNGGCAASITQNCPEFVASWEDGVNTGSGFTYSAATNASGEVIFTVSNPGAPVECSTAAYTATYACDANCPQFVSASASQTSVCTGESTVLNVDLVNADLASVTWTLADGTSLSGANVIAAINSVGGCTETQSITYQVVCIENNSVIASGAVEISVYPNISASTTNGGCAASVSQACPEFTATWNDGTNSGTGFTYLAASGTAGEVQFIVSNPNAPANCASASYAATYDCASDCPSVISASVSEDLVCNGSTIDLNVELSDASLATVNWTLPGGSTANGASVSVEATSIGACTENLTYSYTVTCNGDGSTLESGTLAVTVYPSISATVSNGGCAASISQDCPEFTATWIDNNNVQGTGFSYSSVLNSSGTVSFTIANANAPADCSSASFNATYECLANCPSFTEATVSQTDVCNNTEVALNVVLSDPSLATVTWTLPDGSAVNGVSNNVIASSIGGCTETLTYSYVVTCIEDNSLIASGNLNVNVYPTITASILDEACTASISQNCAEFTATWSNTDTGESGEGFEYSAAPGTSGAVTFSILNTAAIAGCDGASFTANYDCPANCPSFNSAAVSDGNVCDGTSVTLSVDISDTSLATVIWTSPSDESFTGEAINVVAESISGCSETLGYTYRVVCNENESIIATGFLNVNVYPAITASITNGGCSASITQDCEEFTASWTDTDGNSGEGFIYSASFGQVGTVTYTVANADAPEGCATAVYEATYDCQANCPSITEVPSDAFLCSGESATLSVVSEAGATIEWLNNGTVVSTDFSYVTDVLENTNCAPTSNEYTYTVTCIDDGSVLLSNTVSVTVYPTDIDAFISILGEGTCVTSLSVDASCENFITVTPEEQTAEVGTSGNHTFNISYDYGESGLNCLSTNSFLVAYNCESDCEASAGTLTANQATVCVEDGGNIIALTGTAPTIPAGSSLIYVLTSGSDLVIEAVSDIPSFDGLGLGSYTIHTLVYDPATLDLSVVEFGVTTGVDVLNIITDNELCASLLVEGAAFNVIECGVECIADAGTLTADAASACIEDGGNISASVGSAAVVPEGSSIIYVLTSGSDLVIEAVSDSPAFDGLGLGSYTIHTLVYDPATLDLSVVEFGVTTGVDVLNIITDNELCASLLVDGAAINVVECGVECLADAGTLTADAASACIEDGGNISASVGNVAVVPEGSSVIYVLTSGADLVIEAVSDSPSFDGLGLGSYTIHTLVYDPATLDLSVVEFGVTTGADVLNIITDNELCASLLVAGASVNVIECTVECTADAGTLAVLNDTEYCGPATLQAATDQTPVQPAGSTLVYVLTSGDDLVIQQTGPSPTFTVDEPGTYTIHTLVFDATTLDLGIVVPGETTGVDVLNIITDNELCASLLVDGPQYTIYEPFDLGITGTTEVVCNNADEGESSVDLNDLLDETVAGTGVWDLMAFPFENLDGTVFDANGLEAGQSFIAEYTIASGNDACPPYSIAYAVNIVDCAEDCNADAGTLVAVGDTDLCGDLVTIMAEDDISPTGPTGYVVNYVLTQGDDLVIVQLNGTPMFDITEGGSYTIHSLVYDETTLDLSVVELGVTTGVDVLNLITDNEICASLLVDGPQFTLTNQVDLGSGGSLSVCNETADGETTLDFSTYIPEGVSGEWTSDAPEDAFDGSVLNGEGIESGTTYTFSFVSEAQGPCESASVEYEVLVLDCDGTGEVTGTVFNDWNGNIEQDDNESGIAGVDVTLTGAGLDGEFDTDDDIVLTTTTDADGNYSFTDAPIDSYYLFFTTPEPFINNDSDVFQLGIGETTVVDFAALATIECDNPIEIDIDILCNDGLETYDVTVAISGGYPEFNNGGYTIFGTVAGEFSETFTVEDIDFNAAFTLFVTDNANCTAEVNATSPCEKPLSANLIEFNGRVEDAGNQLNWITASEIDNDYFTLERSTDGINFEAIATIDSKGNSTTPTSYDFLDTKANAVNYYRLEQTDINGITNLSEIIMLTREEGIGAIDLVPNPAIDQVNVLFELDGATTVELSVYDIMGRLINQSKIDGKKGSNNINLPIDAFDTGVYFITIADGQNIRINKLIKE